MPSYVSLDGVSTAQPKLARSSVPPRLLRPQLKMRFSMLLLLFIGLVASSNACTIHSIAAHVAGQPFLPQSPNAYNTKQVVDALEGIGATNGRFVTPKTTTFACVDARGGGLAHGGSAVSTLETPGGDFAELVALIISYHRVKNTTVSESSVRRIFNSFVKKVASSKRPFYLHTSDDKLQYALHKFQDITGEHAIVVPNVEPSWDKNATAAWYDALSTPDAQGCGHVRYMMQKPSSYDLNTPEEAAVPAHLIKAFFKYWWPTPEGSDQRSRIIYPILQGTLGGGALAIVNSVGPACLGQEPDLAPFHGGSSMFLYQGNAVTALRSSVLIPFIKGYDHSINATAVLSALNDLQGKQLTATLKLLAPLNALPIYQVDLVTDF